MLTRGLRQLQVPRLQGTSLAELLAEMSLAVAGKFVQVQAWIQVHALHDDGLAIQDALHSSPKWWAVQRKLLPLGGPGCSRCTWSSEARSQLEVQVYVFFGVQSSNCRRGMLTFARLPSRPLRTMRLSRRNSLMRAGPSRSPRCHRGVGCRGPSSVMRISCTVTTWAVKKCGPSIVFTLSSTHTACSWKQGRDWIRCEHG